LKRVEKILDEISPLFEFDIDRGSVART